MGGFVYILASQRNGTLYTGVTNNIARRVAEHREENKEAFAGKYKAHILVYYEAYDRIEDAIVREKRLKKWNRAWKLRVIEDMNPDWRDLYEELNN